MSKKVRNIFGLVALVVMFTACSKDAELYTPQNALQQEKEQIKPSAMPLEPGSSNSGQGNGGTTGGSGTTGGGVANSSNNGKPNTTSVGNGLGNGNISISDDDDDEDDDN